MNGRPLWLLGVATILATMLYTIDSTIVNVALPHMQGTLQATQDQAGWIVTSYIVISAIATPLAGWLGTRFGLRRVLSISIAGFTVGSMLCGIATGLDQMVVFRVIQGAFGAALVPLSQVVLLQTFPREQHSRVMALWGMGVMVGPVIGPTLGGWLTDSWSWRWAFYINLPIGVIAWVGMMAAIPKSQADENRPFDGLGFVLLSLAIGLFQMMIDRGETRDWFASTEIVAYAFFAAVFFYMYVVHSLTTRHPFVDVHLFKDANFLVCLIVMFAIGLTLISTSVLLPGFLQQLQGLTPTQAGVLMAARGASSIGAMLIGARLQTTVGPRATTAIGIFISAASLWFMGHFSIDTPRSAIVIASILQGIGTPLAFMPLSLLAFATLTDRMRTEAGAILTLVRNIGASVGVSGTIALLTRSAQTNQSYLSEHFTAYSLERWLSSGITPGSNTGTGRLIGELGRQALGIAYANDFFLLAVCTLLPLPLMALLKRSAAPPPKALAAADAGGH